MPAQSKPALTYVGTSWKMTKTLGESRAFAREVLEWGGWGESVTPFVLPTLVSLTAVRETVPRESGLLVGAQNGHWAEEGAHTGEVSMRQLTDAGADIVEIGHSERRADHDESAEGIVRKVHAALGAGLMPLVCVGEAQEIRDLGAHVDFVRGQAIQALAGVDAAARPRILLAYEPVWAIGEGGRSPKLDEIAGVVSALSSDHPDIAGVLYGGSVTAANARDLLDLDGVCGLFVGRGAWTPSSFIDILRTAT